MRIFLLFITTLFSMSTYAIDDSFDPANWGLSSTSFSGTINYGTVLSGSKISATFKNNSDEFLTINSLKVYSVNLNGSESLLVTTSDSSLLGGDGILDPTESFGIQLTLGLSKPFPFRWVVNFVNPKTSSNQEFSTYLQIKDSYKNSYMTLSASGSTSTYFYFDSDLDGVSDGSDLFPFDAAESKDTDTDGIGNNADTDDDNDGISDDFEIKYGLDPLDLTDAELDNDSDGVTNLEEFNAGTNPTIDDYAPVFDIESLPDIEVTAAGKLTYVTLPDIFALDGLDGQVKAVSDLPNPLLAGKYSITWTASDLAGNSATNTQNLIINPVAQIDASEVVVEGGSIGLDIRLIGEPQSFPVTIPLTYSGTATLGDDFDAPESVIIDSGDSNSLFSNSIQITTTLDQASEGSESIIITLGEPDNGVGLASYKQSVINIVEEPLRPTVSINVTQNGNTSIIDPNGGSAQAVVVLKNVDGIVTTDWSGSDNRLPIEVLSGNDATLIGFDPSSLAEDFYMLNADVTYEAFSGEIFSRDTLLNISSEASNDDDNDGISNDYDFVIEPNLLGIKFQDGTYGETYQSDVGTTLLLGSIARQYGYDGDITVGFDDIAEGVINTDESYAFVGGLLDLEIELPVAGSSSSLSLLLPAENGMQDKLVLINYIDGKWSGFVENDFNSLKSAQVDNGNCPQLDSTEYKSGLIEGGKCLVIQMQDGGPNDADENINGVVKVRLAGAIKLAIDVLGNLSDWLGNTINDVDITINDENLTEVISGAVNSDGTFMLESELTDGAAVLTFTKPDAIDSGTRPITSADALAALKIAVGLNPNSSGEVSPYQFIAADINNDGRVTSADALAILKVAVGLESLPDMAWVFMDSNADTSAITKSSVPVITNNVNVTLPTANDASYIGIMKGNVNGL